MRRSTAFFLLLSACWVLLLYRQVIGAPFLYDDVAQIPQNAQLTSWSGITGYFLHAVPFNKDYRNIGGAFYRPLFWTSLALDRLLWGLNPTAFHLTNLLLHWLNGVLVFALLRRLGMPALPSSAAVMIWLGLPINTEAVAWISGRSVVLMTFFVLAGLLAATWYLSTRRIVALIAYALACAAAVLSYEAGLLILPLTMLIVRLSWPLSAAALAVDAIYFGARKLASATATTAGIAILPAGAAFFKYLAWTILPIHMSIERSSDTPPGRFSITAITALAALAALIALAFWLRKKIPAVAAGIAWMIISLIPFCGIVPTYQGMAERYVYLASAGLAAAIAGLAFRVPPRARTPVLSLVCLWIFWGAWRVDARVLDWNNEIQLYTSSLQATPDSAVLLFNLGIAEAEKGDAANAEDCYRRAIAIHPNYTGAMINLGNILRKQGKASEATTLFQSVLAIDPKNPNAWLNLGNIALQAGNLKDAQADYGRSLELKPTSVEATLDLGAVYQRLGDLDAAQKQYQRASSLDPNLPGPYTNLGAVLIQQGRFDEAIAPLRKAIEKDPTAASPYFNLGVVYEQQHQYPLAAQMYRNTLAIDPDHIRARVGLVRVENEK